MALRDHDPIPLEEFNGLWKRGDIENTPMDHFSDAENIRFIGSAGFGTRYGIDKHQTVSVPLGNVVRIYNYITQDKNTLLVLTYDGTDGKIYHVVNSATVLGPILTKTGMTDFGFIPYAGRAYISPFVSIVSGGLNQERGMQSEFLYVYLGLGANARKAGGSTPAGTLTIGNGAAGNTDPGLHVFAVVGETDTGFLSEPCAFKTFTTSAALSVNFSTIPTFTGAQWTKRHIVATKVISNYNGDTTGYQFFFIPTGTINDNTATTLSNISFFDADLLEDASHLVDNLSEIPAGVGMCIYHDRLVLWTTYTDISLAYVSAQGEPEAINEIDGFLIFPLDGNPITNGAELRDVLYLTKRNRTGAWVDNEDVPSSWPFTYIDQALGCPVHGISTVIDSGSNSVDYLIMTSYRGITLFNGRYSSPELSWKISDYWLGLTRNDFRYIQIINDSINQVLYCALPNRLLLVGDYSNGLDPKRIRWTIWRFDFQINTVALVNINDLIIGAEKRLIS